MKTYGYGNDTADIVLIQPVDEADINGLENEIAVIKKSCALDFRLIAVKIEDWNNELSPWEAPAVFGKGGFPGGRRKDA